MKVVLSCYGVYPFHGTLGLYKQVYLLAKHLVQAGIEVEIVASRPPVGKSTEVYDGIRYTFLPPKCLGRPLLGVWQHAFNLNLALYLRRASFDILHASPNSAYFYLHLPHRQPTVVNPVGLEAFLLPGIYPLRGIKRLYWDVLLRRTWQYCLTHADALAIEGSFQLPLLAALGVPQERTFDSPPGIDISAIRAQAQQQGLSRSQIGLKDNELVLISVNRFSPIRGIAYLIEAFALIKKRIANARLLLLGEEDYQFPSHYAEIMDRIRALGLAQDVVCFRNVPEAMLYSYYAVADIYVSPTFFDDFLMSILEAMAFGLPVVSTGQGFVVKTGVNGYVVPKRDPQALADAVTSMCRNGEIRAMGAKSLEVVQEYDFRHIASRTIEKYRELMGRKA